MLVKCVFCRAGINPNRCFWHQLAPYCTKAHFEAQKLKELEENRKRVEREVRGVPNAM